MIEIEKNKFSKIFLQHKLFTLFGMLILVMSTSHTFAYCHKTPNADEVSLFEHTNYGGRCTTLKVGNYPNSKKLGIKNDSVSSIKVGSNVKAYVCRDSNYGGRCETITRNDSRLSNNAIGNDKISSAKVLAVNSAVNCNPGSNQIAVYIHSNYRGGCVKLGFGNYSSSSAIGLPNDSISSIKVGANAQAMVCRDVNYLGHCELINKNDANLSNNSIKNDAISSMKVQRRGTIACRPGSGQVAFYMHTNYQGPCVVRSIGKYPTAATIGLANDSISSVRVGSNAQAIVCRDVRYGGHCELITKDDPKLANNSIGNDKISSAKVQALGTHECTPGANEVALYMHNNFISPCVIKGIGNYSNASRIGLPNDSITGVRVGANVQAILCRDTNYLGHCIKVTGNIPHLGRTAIKNDKVSSIKVQTRGTIECAPGSNEASFYMHSEYLAPCSKKAKGKYANQDAIGVKGISSIRVGSNVSVCACTQNDFKGTCEAISSNDQNLGNNKVRNDQIHSAKVTNKGEICKAENTTPSGGFSEVRVSNCHIEKRTVHVWYFEQGVWQTKGSLSYQNCSGGAPIGNPVKFDLKDGLLYQIVIVDPQLLTCNGKNDPTISACRRLTTGARGNKNGPILPIRVN